MENFSSDGIEITRQISAQAETVFEVLSEAKWFSQWFGGTAVGVPLEHLDYSASAGREWSAVMVLPDSNRISWAGEFVEVESPSVLEMTLTDNPQDPARAGLRFTVEGNGSVAALKMAQQTPGFTDEQKSATITGWQSFLDVVVELAENYAA